MVRELNSFRPTTCAEIEGLIKEYGLKTSQEDPIPSFLLKSCLDIILPLFVDIVNKSLSEGCMDGIKESVITPLLKKAGLDYEQFKNFRPVNTLLFLSKLTERVVLLRLNEHMCLNCLHESSQFGYKKFHSTETMILGITDEVLRGFDENLVTVIIVLDLSAAFDILDPEKLVQILHTDTCIQTFKSKYGKRIFEYSASRYWNVLPTEIKTTENINKLKKLLKTLLFKEFDNIKK